MIILHKIAMYDSFRYIERKKGVYVMNVTIYDVAREANVSMATVSRVVNGNPNVKPSTRKKVLEVIERLGYRPNAVARGLASKKNDNSRRHYSGYFEHLFCRNGTRN